jgi:Flp pilus assembly protein TadG
MRQKVSGGRRAVAAVEFALTATFVLVPLMVEIWEVGRLVQVHQLVSNSAREGARRAAQAYTINSSGSPTQVTVSSGTTTVTDAVYNYLYAAGLTNLSKSDVQVSFQFLAPRSDGAAATEPYQGEKGQPFSVTVTVPWNKVRWVNLGVINPTSLTFTVDWRMLVDDKFALDPTLPTW